MSVTETEAKYEADFDTALPDLDSLPQVAGMARTPEQILLAVYYDTPDLRLLRAGITLRRRTGGSDAGWHLKLPVSGRTREEIRLPLDGDQPRAGSPRVPRELADLVRSRSRDAALSPVARVSTRRQATELLDSAGQVLAELADDRVSAQRERDPASASSWREVEVELVGGDTDLLAAVDDVLRRHGLTVSARSAKLERVLSSELAQTVIQPPTAATPASQVITSYLAQQAEELVALDPMVRRFRPDAVHKMRIACRRMRSTLRSFGAVIRASDTEHLAGELKWLGDVLGRARDAEVLAAHLRAQQDQTDVADLLGPVAARIDGHFARSGARARAAVLTTLSSRRYTELLTDLDALITDPPRGPEGGAAAGPTLADAVARSYRTTRRRMHRALASSPGRDRDVALHQARKAAKRTRYAAEAVVPVAGKDASRFASQMKQLQTVLGDHQDTVIARQLERSLGLAAHRGGENAFSYGLFYERDACDARLLQDLVAQVWSVASRPRYRHWLGSAA